MARHPKPGRARRAGVAVPVDRALNALADQAVEAVPKEGSASMILRTIAAVGLIATVIVTGTVRGQAGSGEDKAPKSNGSPAAPKPTAPTGDPFGDIDLDAKASPPKSGHDATIELPPVAEARV